MAGKRTHTPDTKPTPNKKRKGNEKQIPSQKQATKKKRETSEKPVPKKRESSEKRKHSKKPKESEPSKDEFSALEQRMFDDVEMDATIEQAPDTSKMDITALLEYGEGISKGPPLQKPDVEEMDSSDESDWEEVETLEEKPYTIPKEGVEITIAQPTQTKKKKGFDLEAYMRRQLMRRRREVQVDMHCVHLLCLIAHGRYINSVLNSESLLGSALSLIPNEQCYPPKRIDMNYLEKFMHWFRKRIPLSKEETVAYEHPLEESLQERFEEQVAKSRTELVFMFVVVLRALGVEARLIMSLQPVSMKIRLAPDKAGKNKDGEEDGGTPSKSSDSSANSQPEVKSKSTSGKCHTKATKKPANSTSKGKSKGTNSISEVPPKLATKSTKHTSDVKVETKPDVKSPAKNSVGKTLRNRINHKKATQVKDESTSEDITDCEVQKLGDRKSSAKVIILETKSDKVQRSHQAPQSLSGRSKLKTEENVKGSSTTTSNGIVEQVKSKGKSKPLKLPEKANPKRKSSFMLRKVKPSTSYKESSGSDAEITDESPEEEAEYSNSSSDFEELPERPRKNSSSPKEVRESKKDRHDIWVEVYMEQEEHWMTIDILKEKLHCSSEMESRVTPPVSYVLAFSNNLSVKDVTRRYASHWMSHTQKLRVEKDWWEESLRPFRGKRSRRDKMEDEELDEEQMQRPMPTAIGEFKNHPLYALRRHLLKFEAIYPPNAPTLGFIRKEPVYARECVRTLHSRATWLKQAKSVRLKEEPYKIVKARPKWDRRNRQVITDQPLELFGEWQVEDYIPPPAVDGKVPRNEYGNVELFQPCMLPKGTVHLQLPGLSRTAKKLGIDCAPAMVGWDFNMHGTFANYDGFVVCEEFKDLLIDAWKQEQVEQRKREREKVEKRALDNWKRLIKGLLIRERLNKKYDFGNMASTSQSNDGAGTSKGKRGRKSSSKK